MWALIKKDIYMLLSLFKSFLFVVVIFFAVSYMNGEPGILQFFSMMIVVFVIMLSISTFTYDNNSHWESYAFTLPISRKTTVASKYLLALFMTVIGTILGIAFHILLTVAIKQPLDFTTLYMLNCFAISGALLLLSVVLPLVYKFGPEKGRYAMMLCYLLPMVLFYLIGSAKGKINIDIEATLAWLQSNAWMLPMVCLVIFFFSFLISVRIYQKKEV